MIKHRRRASAPDASPGDVRLAEGGRAERQNLTAPQRELLERGYRLFEFFETKLRAEHEQMRCARRMRELRQDEQSRTSPPGMTLNSCIDNVIADQTDNMPQAQMVPEREETARSAEEMSDVVAYVLYQANWADTYQRLMEDSVVTGTGVAQAFWDEDMEGGAGMVNVLAWHPEDFYPDPMVEDIQDGRGCFKTTRTTVAWVHEHYPHARGCVRGDRGLTPAEGADAMRETPQGDEPVTLLEFWYRRYDADARRYRVHMAQMAGGALLYSTELGFGGADAEEYREGVYAHGQYPFVLFRYRRVFRRPFGTGLVHDYSSTQHAIDRYQKYIDDNARHASLQRHFIRRGSGISAEEIADLNRQVIEWEGSDIREVLQTVQAEPLSSQVYQIMNYLVDTMKQDCGQNQFSRGEGGLGVTAATAIQALQEAGGKITRWHTSQYKTAFAALVVQIMWILSEYMEPGRKLRIVGGWDGSGRMADRFVELIAPGAQGDRLSRPAYSVRVQVQKNNPLQIQADNEFLLHAAQICAQSGQPLPARSVIALMEGYRTKDSVMRAIAENDATQQELMALRAQVQELALACGERERTIALQEAAMQAASEQAQDADGAQKADEEAAESDAASAQAQEAEEAESQAGEDAQSGEAEEAAGEKPQTAKRRRKRRAAQRGEEDEREDRGEREDEEREERGDDHEKDHEAEPDGHGDDREDCDRGKGSTGRKRRRR